jgi:hypothetical protein
VQADRIDQVEDTGDVTEGPYVFSHPQELHEEEIDLATLNISSQGAEQFSVFVKFYLEG